MAAVWLVVTPLTHILYTSLKMAPQVGTMPARAGDKDTLRPLGPAHCFHDLQLACSTPVVGHLKL